ncbi:MAG TPA: hypothetical protein VGD43_00055 [Micromonospora sp.]
MRPEALTRAGGLRSYLRPGPLVILTLGLTLLAVPVAIVTGADADPDAPAEVVGQQPASGGAGVDPADQTPVTVLSSGFPTGTPTPGTSPTPSTPPTTAMGVPASAGPASPRQLPTPRPTTGPPSPKPVLLGPADGTELSTMVQRYCDQYVHQESAAEPRGDGQWRCRRSPAAPRPVDMTVVCADTYGPGAYARNSGDDAYGWRCYRDAG